MKLRTSPRAVANKREVVIHRSGQNFLRNLLPGHHKNDNDRPILDPDLEPSLPVLANCAHEVWRDPTTGACIYLGPRYAAEASLQDLQEKGIKAVVNCSKRVPCHHEPELQYCLVAINDTEATDILTYLHGATMFIHSYLSRGQSVLVHCEAGVSRSASVVMAYLIQYHNMKRDAAYVHVKVRRRLVQPNEGFWYQLQLFAKHKMGSQKYNYGKHPKLDYEWAKASAAIYATCRHMADFQDRTAILEHCFHALRDKQFAAHPRDVLHVALDFVWGRGALQVEIDWLAQVCRVLDEVASSPCEQPLAADLLRDLLTNEKSVFCQEWQGEVYPEWVQRVLEAISHTEKMPY